MLTALQQRVADLFAQTDLRESFALAGGAALNSYRISDRLTEDLDFFTREPERIAEATRALTAALRAANLAVEVEHRGSSFTRIFVSDDTEQMHVDLAHDAILLPPVPGPLGPTLDRDELAASKVLALFSRAEARDFLDVRDLLAVYHRSDLVRLAARFDPGFDVRVFAEMLGRVATLPTDAFAAPREHVVAVIDLFTSWQAELRARPSEEA